MKKLLALILTLMLAVTMFAACGSEDVAVEDAAPASELATIKEAGKLVIGYTIYEPMNFTKDGEFTGFDTEFALAVCEKLGVEADFVEINWDTKFITLDAKEIDCIWNGMTISDEVKKNCDVSKAYTKNSQVVVMKKDALANYKDAASLKDLKFVAEAGSAGEQAIKDNALDANYTPAATQAEAMVALKAGQADACVIDSTMANSITKEGTDYDTFGYAVELTTEEYGIGYRKGSDLKAEIDKIMDELAADGTLKALAEKYDLNLAF